MPEHVETRIAFLFLLKHCYSCYIAVTPTSPCTHGIRIVVTNSSVPQLELGLDQILSPVELSLGALLGLPVSAHK